MLTIWLDGWFSSAYNIVELLKKNPDNRPIKVIATHHKEMGYKILCDEFYIRPDFVEDKDNFEYKEWALDFARKNEIDIFFPRRYYSTLYKAHKDFVYVDKNEEIRKCKLVLPGIFNEYNTGFTQIFENKPSFFSSLRDWGDSLCKYEPPCWILHDVEDIEDFRVEFKDDYHFNKMCIKPVSGTGAQGFKILDFPYDAWKIRDILQRSGQKFIIMPYFEGNEISIDFLSTYNETIFIPRIKNKENRIQEIVFNDITRELCKNVEKAGIPEVVEVVGNIQFMEHNGEYYLLEVNPRMSGGIYLDSLAGVNFPYLLVKKILGEEICIPKIEECRVVNVERGIRVK